MELRRKGEKLISPRLRRKGWGMPQDLKGCNPPDRVFKTGDTGSVGILRRRWWRFGALVTLAAQQLRDFFFF